MVSKDLIIKHFSDSFLDLRGQTIKKISDILDLPLEFFNNVDKIDVEILREHEIESIRDLGRLEPEQVDQIKELSKINATNLEKMYIGARLVARAWRKRKSYKETEVNKIIVVGLDNAGKTSLIDAIAGKSLSDIVDQEPTPMVNQLQISSQTMNFVLWDFGGQIQYRQQYLQDPENYFVGLDNVMFVADAQDADRYDEAIDYLEKIIDIVNFLNEKPFIQILLHKADPDLMTDPDFQINLQYLDRAAREALQDYKFGSEVIKSSIYSTYQTQPVFTQYLKDIFQKDKVEQEGVMVIDAMMKITDIIVQIGNQLAQKIDAVGGRVDSLEREVQAGFAEVKARPQTQKAEEKPVKPVGVKKSPASPPKIPGKRPQSFSPPPSSPDPEASQRLTLLKELKEMFKKRNLYAE